MPAALSLLIAPVQSDEPCWIDGAWRRTAWPDVRISLWSFAGFRRSVWRRESSGYVLIHTRAGHAFAVDDLSLPEAGRLECCRAFAVEELRWGVDKYSEISILQKASWVRRSRIWECSGHLFKVSRSTTAWRRDLQRKGPVGLLSGRWAQSVRRGAPRALFSEDCGGDLSNAARHVVSRRCRGGGKSLAISGHATSERTCPQSRSNGLGDQWTTLAVAICSARRRHSMFVSVS